MRRALWDSGGFECCWVGVDYDVESLVVGGDFGHLEDSSDFADSADFAGFAVFADSQDFENDVARAN